MKLFLVLLIAITVSGCSLPIIKVPSCPIPPKTGETFDEAVDLANKRYDALVDCNKMIDEYNKNLEAKKK